MCMRIKIVQSSDKIEIINPGLSIHEVLGPDAWQLAGFSMCFAASNRRATTENSATELPHVHILAISLVDPLYLNTVLKINFPFKNIMICNGLP